MKNSYKCLIYRDNEEIYSFSGSYSCILNTLENAMYNTDKNEVITVIIKKLISKYSSKED